MNRLSAELINKIDITINLAENLRIVLIDTSSLTLTYLNEHLHNANIYCVDEKYNIIWQVDSDKGLMDKDSFIYMKKSDQGIEAFRFGGQEYVIEEKTGKSTVTGWHK